MKLLILGPVAAGKTTLAKELAEELDIKVFGMDRIIHYDTTSAKRSVSEQRNIINDIIKNNREWIIEGMPRTHLEVLAANATTIIYLDYDVKVLRKNLNKRNRDILNGKIEIQYDLTDELLEKMNNYIENDKREDMFYLMKKYPRKLFIIKNKKELKKFFAALREGEILKYQ